MRLPIYQVDAFTDRIFGGNPAAICPLETWLPTATMQAIAAENNLAETAFFVKQEDHYELRWFTPVLEIDLCGHATLASAQVMYEFLNYQDNQIHFKTRSGSLRVTQEGNKLSMDFPSRPPKPMEASDLLLEALGVEPVFVGKSRDILVQVEKEEYVKKIEPEMDLVAQLDCIGVIVTAAGEKEDVDFVSRFFAPQAGVPEDPVTGSAHCTLIPFWGEKLGKTDMYARQISPRGGGLWTKWKGDRVEMAGTAVTYLKGEITIDL
ncbi:MAG: PhzF family phenazine biosynthesis protein [Bacteroidota bacterium]